jgi:hypothetical protein
MVDPSPSTDSPNDAADAAPGIAWLPGDEDYPFAAEAGETALGYFERWLRDAPYARVVRGGATYVHEDDVTNVVNHITADVNLLRARLDEFGDHVMTAAETKAATQHIEEAIARLALAVTALSREPQR